MTHTQNCECNQNTLFSVISIIMSLYYLLPLDKAVGVASRAPCRRSHVPFFFTGRGRLLSLFRRPRYRGWCVKKNQCKCHLCFELRSTLKLTIILGGKRHTLARPISSWITLKFSLRLSWNPEMQSPLFRNGFCVCFKRRTKSLVVYADNSANNANGLWLLHVS